MEKIISKAGVIRRSEKIPRLTLQIAGDVIPGGKVAEYFSASKPNSLLRDIQAVLYSGDLLLYNLEASLCLAGKPIPKCGPNFRVSPATAVGLKASGFNVAALANNHIMDFGSEGLKETILALDKAGIAHLGAAETKEGALRPLQLNIKGVRVAFLNWAEGEFSRLGPDGCGAAPMDDVANKEAIEKAKNSNDIVIVSIHAGNEYQHFPSPWLQQKYRSYISYGATVVIGNHPHIPQGLEWHDGGLIVYSMGDFFFEHENDHGTCVTFLLELGLDVGGIISARVRPMKKSADAHMQLLTGSEMKLFTNHLNRLSRPLQSLEELTNLWEQGVIRRVETFYADKLKQNISLAFSHDKEKEFAAGFLYNMFDCPAHSQALQTAFSLIHSGKYHKDSLLQEYISCLNQTLEVIRGLPIPEFGAGHTGRVEKIVRLIRRKLL